MSGIVMRSSENLTLPRTTWEAMDFFSCSNIMVTLAYKYGLSMHQVRENKKSKSSLFNNLGFTCYEQIQNNNDNIAETDGINVGATSTCTVTPQTQVKLRLRASLRETVVMRRLLGSDLLPAGWTTNQVGKWPYC